MLSKQIVLSKNLPFKYEFKELVQFVKFAQKTFFSSTFLKVSQKCNFWHIYITKKKPITDEQPHNRFNKIIIHKKYYV